jgi:hypothetical protein
MSVLENGRERSFAPFEIAADHIGAATQRQATAFQAKILISIVEHQRGVTPRCVVFSGAAVAG